MSSMRLMVWHFVVVLALVPAASAVAQNKQVARTTEGEITRFASLRADDVNVRAGPGVRYPVKWKFVQRNMPVQVIAEYDTWRKIRDWEGAEGWVHRAMLSSKRSLIMVGHGQTLRKDATDELGGGRALGTRVRRHGVALPDRVVRGRCRRLRRLGQARRRMGHLARGKAAVAAAMRPRASGAARSLRHPIS